MAGSVMSTSWEKTLSAIVASRKVFWKAGVIEDVRTVNGAITPLILIFIIFPLLLRMAKNTS